MAYMDPADYPATLSGYFNDLVQAEAAIAELDTLDFGEIPPRFEKVNLVVRRIEEEESAETFFQRLRESFDANHETAQTGVDDAVVMVRGDQELLESRAAPVLERHGAREIRRYGGMRTPSIYSEE